MREARCSHISSLSRTPLISSPRRPPFWGACANGNSKMNGLRRVSTARVFTPAVAGHSNSCRSRLAWANGADATLERSRLARRGAERAQNGIHWKGSADFRG